ncbi:DUF3291 domain-containing protein [uncultured Croceitalea sp.]|uniref:DUF3291 domain-containing protein n=1 Tax=uncultured Croceitalea sp. TaxID=1798908 RepID=UPI0033062264
MSQITTLTFFRFKSFGSKLWAFSMMQFAHRYLANVKGQEFYKLLGTGREGFDPRPDFGTYAVLQVWRNEDAALQFNQSSGLMEKYRKKSVEHYQLYMKNIIARGEWARINPFEKSAALEDIDAYAVITRATIKTKLLIKFWKFVPKSREHLASNPGLLFNKGIGEVPFKNMATFSLWRNVDALNKFAYQTEGHVKAIGKTRELKWYSEELFSRFQPYKSFGTWFGKNPLEYDR